MAEIDNFEVEDQLYDFNAKSLNGLESKDFVKAFSSDSIASISGNNTALYAKIATLNITSFQVDWPVVFEVYGRRIPHTFISIQFQNLPTGTDPNVDKFTINTDYNNFYLKKVAASTWELYVKFEHMWCSIYIRQCFSAIFNKINVTLDVERLTTLPEDCIQVVNGVTANKAETAETANSITNLGRLTSANVSTFADKKITVFQSSSAMTSGKPKNDGFIVNFDWDNNGHYGSQLYIPNNNNTPYLSMQYRKQGGAYWSAQPWITVLDTDNTKLVNGGNMMINGTSQMLGVDITPYLQAGKVMPFSALYRYGNCPVECRIIRNPETNLYICTGRVDAAEDEPNDVYEFWKTADGWEYANYYEWGENMPEWVKKLF